jgi:hypothetical protein
MRSRGSLSKAFGIASAIVVAEFLCGTIYRWVTSFAWSAQILRQAAELAVVATLFLAAAFFVGWSNREKVSRTSAGWSSRFGISATLFTTFFIGATAAGVLLKVLVSPSPLTISYASLMTLACVAGVIGGGVKAISKN